MDTSVRIACCQLAPDVDRPERNPGLAREAIAAAVAGGAQIVEAAPKTRVWRRRARIGRRMRWYQTPDAAAR